MPMGICKLCLKNESLQKSHFMPAAMYKYLLSAGKENPHPVIVGRRVTSTSSQQVQGHLLCKGCEELLNKNGENWITSQVSNGRNFPLLERLKDAQPYYALTDVDAFSGLDLNIDTDKLGYFALSILWRAAVCVWGTPFGGKTTEIQLGSYLQELIRQFLLGRGPFPHDVVVMVHVCSDRASKGSFHFPSQVLGSEHPSFGFQTLGLMFRVFVGANIPSTIRQFCCIRSSKRLIFRRDCSEKVLQAFAQLMATSKPSKNFR